MSNSGSGTSNIKDEIDAAFAAGAMPPEWRPRLLASQRLGEGDVDRIAAAIAEVHATYQYVGSTKGNIGYVAFLFVLGVLFLCVAGLFFRENNYLNGALAVLVAVAFIVIIPMIILLYEFHRWRANMLMAQTRTVLERFLLPPV
ncbi:Os09g0534300 [Oryza sativa Japonica Group]|jgi:hypothetical protein|uniref:Uncharacterized protein n=2 Tax=Oryza sativa subsp. japonica TaxID=39947 RepID=A3C0Y7_ORYSJ|nr:hypothetical protein OsJ_30130 [Oryza sativa Japonica Group]BAD33334.1 hypothetical protein [Oryza sativa Japonica Group]BAT09131.1 Os09g0534300 [Oryza sativa Japonica Group]